MRPGQKEKGRNWNRLPPTYQLTGSGVVQLSGSVVIGIHIARCAMLSACEVVLGKAVSSQGCRETSSANDAE